MVSRFCWTNKTLIFTESDFLHAFFQTALNTQYVNCAYLYCQFTSYLNHTGIWPIEFVLICLAGFGLHQRGRGRRDEERKKNEVILKHFYTLKKVN